MSVINRRMLLCALPAPFLPCVFDDHPRTVQVIVAGPVGFDQRIIDTLIAAIREATNDRDVIIFAPKKRPQE